MSFRATPAGGARNHRSAYFKTIVAGIPRRAARLGMTEYRNQLVTDNDELPSPLVIESRLATHPGQRRDHNEDFVGFYEPTGGDESAAGCLYVICDGVGGAAAGEIASRHAVETILFDYYQSAEPDLQIRLDDAVQHANADIFDFVERCGEGRRMATTLVAAAIQDNRALVANVGDSRAYLIRDGRARQVTRDHSLVQQLVRERRITPEEARTHKRKNVLTRALGNDDTVDVDYFTVPLKADDRLLLCTDGFARYVMDEDIVELCGLPTVESAVERMIAHANESGGADNISVCLLRFHHPSRAPTVERRAARIGPPADMDTLDTETRTQP